MTTLTRRRIAALTGTAALVCASILTLTAPAHAALAPSPIGLGRAADFAVLGGTSVAFNGAQSAVPLGNVGVSPGTSITGNVLIGVGTQEAGTPAAQNAASDAGTAYGTAKLQTCTNTLANSDLSGLTLTPGVYCTDSGFLTLNSGNLALDAQGDANALFVFQTATTLTTGTNTSVLPVNGADPANVVWQVGSGATLGDSSLFTGTVLAQGPIGVGSVTTVAGRLMSQSSVSLAGEDTVTRPLR